MRLEAEREEGGVMQAREISMSRLVDIFVFLSPTTSHPSVKANNIYQGNTKEADSNISSLCFLLNLD